MKVLSRQTNSRNCIICGLDNKLGLKAAFYQMEDNSVGASFKFLPEHQSYPGRTHGGMITALLDEVMGRALWCFEPDIYACTTTLNVTFRKAVPYGTPLKARGFLTSNSKLFFSAKGYICDENGNVLAEAVGKYMKLKNSVITGDEDYNVDDDMCYNIDDGVKELDLPVKD
ncbi:MAG: PaaI family thioesterase [Clostridia bacterium]|nr:PaaI family thioesterase [Clostridia bacterium]